MELGPDTLERLVPESIHLQDEAGAASLALHLERYAFAARNARAGRLLDIACGVGYGTRYLVDHRDDILGATGVDLSPGAIEYAHRHYARPGIDFVNADAMTFEGEGLYDTIVSLETVEHLPDPDAFLTRIGSMLAPNGVLITSVPTTPSVDLNPHHLHDFTAKGFRAMGRARDLTEEADFVQIQRMNVVDIFRGHRFKKDNLRPNLPSYYLRNPAACFSRIACTLRHGFANHYLTLVWRHEV